ncbi:MAG TPA: hypothetical protein VFQ22_03975 [Longimicrobiales bacterium]|nr:hypothetical protein [Longimicrobiales bacterium]
MRARLPSSVLLAAAAAACGGGPPAPPALAYGLPAEPEATYLVGDTAVISMQMLGQRLSLDASSVATYGVRFERAGDGVRVRLAVEDMDAAITIPMAGAIDVDESAVTGDLVFSLDRRGDAAVESQPDVSEPAAQLFASLLTAHTFFPGLPGTALRPGETWSDTVAFEGLAETLEGSQRLVLDYTLRGDTVVDGRSLLAIDFAGLSEQDQSFAMQGMQIHQTSRADVHGRVLWDAAARIMFERVTLAEGTGNLSVMGMPQEVPVSLEVRSHARLQPR